MLGSESDGNLEDAFQYEHALVFGIGGSGDIIGSIPTARLLEQHGVKVTLGGIAWEPAPKDPTVGPRGFDAIDGLERLSATVGLATGETRTHDGVTFTESHVAAHYSEPVFLIDITQGSRGMIDGLTEACRKVGIDLVIGTDSGGDVLARGDEPGLRSPITDGLGLVTLDELDIDTCLGVFGYGSDGELTIDELEAGIERTAKRGGLFGGWAMTPRIRANMEAVLEQVTTEASRLPVEAMHGNLGERAIRDGDVSVHLTPPSVVTFYFDPTIVAATSQIVPYIYDSRDLADLRASFAQAGFVTEFEREQERLESED